MHTLHFGQVLPARAETYGPAVDETIPSFQSAWQRPVLKPAPAWRPREPGTIEETETDLNAFDDDGFRDKIERSRGWSGSSTQNGDTEGVETMAEAVARTNRVAPTNQGQIHFQD